MKFDRSKEELLHNLMQLAKELQHLSGDENNNDAMSIAIAGNAAVAMSTSAVALLDIREVLGQIADMMREDRELASQAKN